MSDFITDCMNGDALMSDVNDYIDRWHEGNSAQPLHTFLGMTEKEYTLFVEDENYLGMIISARKNHAPLESFVRDEIYAMAARSDSAAKSKRLQTWLESEGLWH